MVEQDPRPSGWYSVQDMHGAARPAWFDHDRNLWLVSPGGERLSWHWPSFRVLGFVEAPDSAKAKAKPPPEV